ncbi:MAG TPA: hypothetical protein VHT28_15575 [Silvibacterium sp.]|nr:hypothetical protein [Silvibacterium sp.]
MNDLRTNPPTPEVTPSTDAELVDALAGLNAQADRAIVHRTRRAVMEAAHRMGAAEVRRRRQLGIILLAFAALVVLLTPAIWSVADDLFSGEHFQDMPAMTMSLIVTLFSTIFAALIVHWRSRQTHNGEKF